MHCRVMHWFFEGFMNDLFFKVQIFFVVVLIKISFNKSSKTIKFKNKMKFLRVMHHPHEATI